MNKSGKLQKFLLLIAGLILVAHTKDEFVLKKDLEEAVNLYCTLTTKLPAEADNEKL